MDFEGIKAHIERRIPLYSTKALQDFHRSIGDGLAAEDALPLDGSPRHGFRQHADFRWETDAIEAELQRRGEAVQPIKW